MYCKLKYVVIYLKLLTNFVILRSFGNLIKTSEITKDHGGGTVHHPVTLKTPITFHDVTVHDWNYRIFHPKSCIMYTDDDAINY